MFLSSATYVVKTPASTAPKGFRVDAFLVLSQGKHDFSRYSGMPYFATRRAAAWNDQFYYSPKSESTAQKKSDTNSAEPTSHGRGSARRLG